MCIVKRALKGKRLAKISERNTNNVLQMRRFFSCIITLKISKAIRELIDGVICKYG